jgi:hypothetical protein
MSRDPKVHNCPACLRNGGHHVAPTEEALPAWAQPAKQPDVPARRLCSYWSARNHEHCGDTDKVRLHPGIGLRCPTHDPDLLNATYRQLVGLADAK